MKAGSVKKMLVILPPDDVRKIDEQVREGRYVTKSDFIRMAVKQLLYGIGKSESNMATQSSSEAETLSSAKILEMLRANMAKIRAIGVKEIGLFGSYAKNEQSPDSDIDILVEFSAGRSSFHSYMKLKLLLEGIFKKKVDLVVKNGIRHELKQGILGSVVYA
ncbi:MAG: nucleotidyltransferase domain-containing protein [Candidatus Marsarchaeota archaeon]|jgi:predicted nucleotidyltransferase|nr:nucleotidyltransferase domain-containing protein [Candidatus Marsarchaeota archaeon]MCL5111286.1 nucleotidyltransferase domain-containing protein [Candidatus Marsarchaeota archaeon]